MKKKAIAGLLAAAMMIIGGMLVAGSEAKAAKKNSEFEKTHLDYYKYLSIDDVVVAIDNAVFCKPSMNETTDKQLVLNWLTSVDPFGEDSFTDKQIGNIVEGYEVYVYKDKKWKKLGTEKFSKRIKRRTGYNGKIYYTYKYKYNTTNWVGGNYKFKVRAWGYADEQKGKYSKKKVYGPYSNVLNMSAGNPAKNAMKLKSVKSTKPGEATVSYVWGDGTKLTSYFPSVGYLGSKFQIYISTDKNFKKNVKKVSSATFYWGSTKAIGQYEKYGKQLRSYTIKGLKKGKTYYVKMRIKRWNNSKDVMYSNWSNVKTVKVKSK